MTSVARLRQFWTPLLLMAGLATVGCERSAQARDAGDDPLEAPRVIVDSIFPAEEEIRRFRAEIGPAPDSLQGGAESIDGLVDLFMEALEAEDRSAFGPLVLSIEEFAYLYYPHTRYTQPPYRMSPALLWFQLENYGSSGLSRTLNRFGGEPMGEYTALCPDESVDEERNRLWSGCIVRIVQPDGETVDRSLFGGILERDGRFKFVNLASGI